MNADVIKFTVNIQKENKISAYVMPLVTNVANIQFKSQSIFYIDQKFNQAAYIQQREVQEIEL